MNGVNDAMGVCDKDVDQVRICMDKSEFENVLKCGRNNSKIGGDVLVGRLRGARIFTLTLEERATCPRSCAMWRAC